MPRPNIRSNSNILPHVSKHATKTQSRISSRAEGTLVSIGTVFAYLSLGHFDTIYIVSCDHYGHQIESRSIDLNIFYRRYAIYEQSDLAAIDFAGCHYCEV